MYGYGPLNEPPIKGNFVTILYPHNQSGSHQSSPSLPVTPIRLSPPGLPALQKCHRSPRCGPNRPGVSTPFYSLPVHSLFSSPPLPLPLPLTALIPTSFANLCEGSQPSREPLRSPATLSRQSYPVFSLAQFSNSSNIYLCFLITSRSLLD